MILPGQTLRVKFGEKSTEEPLVRQTMHYSAFVWVYTPARTRGTYYVCQCMPRLDRHRVVALYASEDLANLARDQLDKLIEIARRECAEPEAHEGVVLGVRKWLTDAHLRWERA